MCNIHMRMLKEIMNLGKTVIRGVGRRDIGLDMMKNYKKELIPFIWTSTCKVSSILRVFFLLPAIYGRALEIHPEVSLLDECTSSQRGRKV